MKIEWTKVTRFSQFTSIVLFVGVFVLGIALGMEYQLRAVDHALQQLSATRTGSPQ